MCYAQVIHLVQTLFHLYFHFVDLVVVFILKKKQQRIFSATKRKNTK